MVTVKRKVHQMMQIQTAKPRMYVHVPRAGQGSTAASKKGNAPQTTKDTYVHILPTVSAIMRQASAYASMALKARSATSLTKPLVQNTAVKSVAGNCTGSAACGEMVYVFAKAIGTAMHAKTREKGVLPTSTMAANAPVKTKANATGRQVFVNA